MVKEKSGFFSFMRSDNDDDEEKEYSPESIFRLNILISSIPLVSSVSASITIGDLLFQSCTTANCDKTLEYQITKVTGCVLDYDMQLYTCLIPDEIVIIEEKNKVVQKILTQMNKEIPDYFSFQRPTRRKQTFVSAQVSGLEGMANHTQSLSYASNSSLRPVIVSSNKKPKRGPSFNYKSKKPNLPISSAQNSKFEENLKKHQKMNSPILAPLPSKKNKLSQSSPTTNYSQTHLTAGLSQTSPSMQMLPTGLSAHEAISENPNNSGNHSNDKGESTIENCDRNNISNNDTEDGDCKDHNDNNNDDVNRYDHSNSNNDMTDDNDNNSDTYSQRRESTNSNHSNVSIRSNASGNYNSNNNKSSIDFDYYGDYTSPNSQRRKSSALAKGTKKNKPMSNSYGHPGSSRSPHFNRSGEDNLSIHSTPNTSPPSSLARLQDAEGGVDNKKPRRSISLVGGGSAYRARLRSSNDQISDEPSSLSTNNLSPKRSGTKKFLKNPFRSNNS